jgi:hypothetical protein
LKSLEIFYNALEDRTKARGGNQVGVEGGVDKTSDGFVKGLQNQGTVMAKQHYMNDRIDSA